MSQTAKNQPTMRLYAVPTSDNGTNSADWVEVAAVFNTSKDGYFSIAKKHCFDTLMATGQYDLVGKAVDTQQQ